jgi:hypothetical protein
MVQTPKHQPLVQKDRKLTQPWVPLEAFWTKRGNAQPGQALLDAGRCVPDILLHLRIEDHNSLARS